MKTQINTLLSGSKNQILNDQIDYSQFPQATSHRGHGGTNRVEVNRIYSEVKKENPEQLTIKLFDHVIELKANWSKSGKSCSYFGALPKEVASMFFTLPKDGTPYIQIDNANSITISNGKNAYQSVCPSLIEILIN